MEREKKDNVLFTTMTFKSFSEAVGFMIRVALLAEQQDHHPRMIIDYKKVELRLTTHDAGDTITERDDRLAAAISTLLQP